MSEIPNTWAVVKLRDIAATINYGHTASANEQRVGPRLLRITDIQDDRVEWSRVPFCVCDDVEKYNLAAGDIVVARTGATTGKSYLINTLPEPAVFASYLIRIQPSTAVQPAYLSWFMQSPTYWEQITTVSKGTAQPGANASLLGDLDIPLAPIGTQSRIVSKIESLTARSRRAKEALDAIPTLLEQFRQSVLAAAFRGDLTAEWRAKNPEVEPAEVLLKRIRIERRKRWEEAELAKMRAKGKAPGDDRWKAKYEEPEPIDTSELPELPDGWGWARAEEVCELITKGTTPSADKLFPNSGDVPYIKVYNLTHRGHLDFSVDPTFISTETHHIELARSRVLPGDILMNIVGPPLGKISIVPPTYQEWNINQAIAVFRPISGLHRDFLCAYLLKKATIEALARQAKATAGQFNLTLEICRNTAVPLAPFYEQEQVARIVLNALKRIDQVHSVGSTFEAEIKRINRSILSKAFRGELVPQDPHDEPASVLLERFRAPKEASPATKRAKKPRG